MKMITRADAFRLTEIAEAFDVTKLVNNENLSSIEEIKDWIRDKYKGRHKASLSVLPDMSFSMEIE